MTWSNVQATWQTIARTQAYALRELDSIAEKLQGKADLGEIARATKNADPKVQEWLAVLARTFQLQGGVSAFELDRVLASAAEEEELEAHRLGPVRARQNGLDRIGHSTAALLTKMDETVQKANAKVLLNPFDSPAAVKSSNQVPAGVHGFRGRLGTEEGHETASAKRWGEAAGKVLEKVHVGTAEGAARRSSSGIAPLAVPPRSSTPSTSTVTAFPTSLAPQPQLDRQEQRSREPPPASPEQSAICSSAKARPPIPRKRRKTRRTKQTREQLHQSQAQPTGTAGSVLLINSAR